MASAAEPLKKDEKKNPNPITTDGEGVKKTEGEMEIKTPKPKVKEYVMDVVVHPYPLEDVFQLCHCFCCTCGFYKTWPQCFGIASVYECICCSIAGMCRGAKTGPGFKACLRYEGFQQCCDADIDPFIVCKYGGEGVCCFCTQFASLTQFKKPAVCCKGIVDCFCIDQRYALPNDEDVPFAFGCCGKWAIPPPGYEEEKKKEEEEKKKAEDEKKAAEGGEGDPAADAPAAEAKKTEEATPAAAPAAQPAAAPAAQPAANAPVEVKAVEAAPAPADGAAQPVTVQVQAQPAT
mmetsp:Transcript_7174/g.13288  ORF Transcript_7174/g.13288 Transcript_7174/m.13288 type:complete len:291 (-) Transcript_7174:250-1122(-)|eukprot:CAMPEP_0197525132 /NCGR_PEP_ID=MMETSP1318-20131121/10639_1 /TAXON_ID=552666 /ORGANISM="Partenskyella glossopodia, Strain RCC365" /LENGTH=290 /DNA_ID=CAMNT_0043078303 /DNA_START=122 /DNA_END=994 /DNA_ORIENTATION=-